MPTYSSSSSSSSKLPPRSPIDTWSIARRDGSWLVVDRNGCEVASCGDRREDAELIVHYSRAHEQLWLALKAALPYLESSYANLESIGMEFDDARLTLERAAEAIKQVTGRDPVPLIKDTPTGDD